MQLDGEAIGTYDIKRIYLVSEMLDVKKQKTRESMISRVLSIAHVILFFLNRYRFHF